MNPVILAHGGVGAPTENSDGPERACRESASILQQTSGDAALNAVINAAVILEDDPRFNAGTGSNFRITGELQQDAILATCDGRMGGVACIESTKNPIQVARLVMDTPHVLLCGDGATEFARQRGHDYHDCSTERSHKRLAKAKERLESGAFRETEKTWEGFNLHGTIGAVARDANGKYAVSCSTGGTSMMMKGRVGDSPIFGAGVMCGPAGAICATGDGEIVMKRLTSMRAYLRLEKGEHPQEIADDLVQDFPRPWVLGLIIVSEIGHGIAATDDIMARYALEL